MQKYVLGGQEDVRTKNNARKEKFTSLNIKRNMRG
jgi:hypothetical protein